MCTNDNNRKGWSLRGCALIALQLRLDLPFLSGYNKEKDVL